MINGKAKWDSYDAIISYEIFLCMIPLSFRTFFLIKEKYFAFPAVFRFLLLFVSAVLLKGNGKGMA